MKIGEKIDDNKIMIKLIFSRNFNNLINGMNELLNFGNMWEINKYEMVLYTEKSNKNTIVEIGHKFNITIAEVEALENFLLCNGCIVQQEDYDKYNQKFGDYGSKWRIDNNGYVCLLEKNEWILEKDGK